MGEEAVQPHLHVCTDPYCHQKAENLVGVPWYLSFTIFTFKKPFFTNNRHFFELHIFKLSIFTSSIFNPVIFQVIRFFTLKIPNLQSSKKTGTPPNL